MFRSIKAENFYSWKELHFDFKSGVTLIEGWNDDDQTSEGSGKSSIFEALVWCLYGQSSRDVNIDDVIRTGQTSCIVEVQLEDGTVIVRSRKPNQLFIQNGDAVHIGKDAKETQRFINETIGMSFDTFCNSVYFAQNYTNKFITASQEDKAKIFSELQDLSIFDRSSKRAADRLKQLKLNLSLLSNDLMHKNGILSLIEGELNTFNKLSDTFDLDKINKLDKLIQLNDSLHKQYNEADKELKAIDNLDSIQDKEQLINEYNTHLNSLQQKVYHIDALKRQKEQAILNKSCPTCGQDTLGNQCNDIVIEDDTDLKIQVESYKQRLLKEKEQYQLLINKNYINNELTNRLVHLREKMKELNTRVTEIESMNNPYIDKMIELQSKHDKLSKDILKAKQEFDQKTKESQYLEFLKDGFKEIKSHVFQSLLQELNDKTNRYLRDLFELPCSITFHNISDNGEINKIKTTVLLDGYERSLGLLSGGQFRRVQLAVDFALSDIVSQRSKNPVNVRILDEVMKDLSESSMSKVIDIVQQMSGSTIIIEHNSMIKNIVNNVFNVELKNGISYEN